MTVTHLERRSEVDHDIEHAVAWYARRDVRLVARLLSEIDEAFTRILENPSQFPVVYKDVRRVLLRRFPFGVYYVALKSKVQVIAVMDLHQHPDTWRLSDR